VSRRERRRPVDPGRPGPREQQFGELYDAHAPALLAYLARRLDRPADAADILAEVFVVAWRRIADVPGGGDTRPWLFGVARMMLRNERRRQHRQHALGQRLRAELIAHPLVVPPPAVDGPGAGVVAALRRMAPDDRELLMLVGWDGLTPSQAATVLGAPPATIRVRLHRARHELRRLLELDTISSERLTRTGQVVDRRATVALPGLEES